MKRVYFFLARAMVVLIVLIVAFFTVRVIQTVQAESRYSGGALNLNMAYPVTSPMEVHITGTGTGSEIVISTPDGIDCGTSCYKDFPYGSKVKLVAGTDSPDLVFVQWIVNGALGPTTSLLTVTMDSPKIIFAVFNYKENPKNYLTVSRVGTTTGKITSAPAGIDCGVSCGALFTPGTPVTLTAEIPAGEMLEKWVVNGVDAGYAPTLNLTMDMNQNVLAVYGAFKYRLNVIKIGSGTVTSDLPGINCGATCLNALYAPNTVVKLTATPGTGGLFEFWDLGGGNTSTDNPLTVTMDADKTITAKFTGLEVNLVTTITGGQNPGLLTFDYTVTITNQGPDTATGATVSESTSPGSGTNLTWICTASAGAVCDASGTGALADTVTIPSGGVLTYTLHRAWTLTTFTFTVTATPPEGVTDSAPADNSDSISSYFLILPIIGKQ